MLAEAVVLERPALCGADAEEAGVLTGAVVLEPAAVHGATLEVVLRRSGARKGSRTAASCSARAWCEAEAMATSSSARSSYERTRRSAWIGLAAERMNVTRPASPRSSASDPVESTRAAWMGGATRPSPPDDGYWSASMAEA